jgi:hypothetical protein
MPPLVDVNLTQETCEGFVRWLEYEAFSWTLDVMVDSYIVCDSADDCNSSQLPELNGSYS